MRCSKQQKEGVMEEPMVTIPLHEYNSLRDEANKSNYLMHEIEYIRGETNELRSRVYDIEQGLRKQVNHD